MTHSFTCAAPLHGACTSQRAPGFSNTVWGAPVQASWRTHRATVSGTDEDGSDLDLLVDALPGATLFDLGGLHAELEDLLGVRVDLLTPADLPQRFRAKVLAEAVPV